MCLCIDSTRKQPILEAPSFQLARQASTVYGLETFNRSLLDRTATMTAVQWHSIETSEVFHRLLLDGRNLISSNREVGVLHFAPDDGCASTLLGLSIHFSKPTNQ